MLKVSIFLSLAIVAIMAFAKDPDCVPVSLKTPGLYFIQNHSKQSIWIEHPTKRASASAGWSSYLRPNHWSALLLNQSDFILHCAVMVPGKVEALDCKSVLTICTPSKVIVNQKKSYWVAEDQTFDEMKKTVKKRGFSF